MIRDLLNPSAGILDLREDSKGGIQVAGLSEVKARSTDEVSCVIIYVHSPLYYVLYSYLSYLPMFSVCLYIASWTT